MGAPATPARPEPAQAPGAAFQREEEGPVVPGDKRWCPPERPGGSSRPAGPVTRGGEPGTGRESGTGRAPVLRGGAGTEQAGGSKSLWKCSAAAGRRLPAPGRLLLQPAGSVSAARGARGARPLRTGCMPALRWMHLLSAQGACPRGTGRTSLSTGCLSPPHVAYLPCALCACPPCTECPGRPSPEDRVYFPPRTGCSSPLRTAHVPPPLGVFTLCTRCTSSLRTALVPSAQGACPVCTGRLSRVEGARPLCTQRVAPLHRARRVHVPSAQGHGDRRTGLVGPTQSQKRCCAQPPGVLHPAAGLPGWVCAQDTPAPAPPGRRAAASTLEAELCFSSRGCIKHTGLFLHQAFIPVTLRLHTAACRLRAAPASVKSRFCPQKMLPRGPESPQPPH